MTDPTPLPPDADAARRAFAREAGRPPSGVLRELWAFMRQNKKWWITPIVALLLLLGALMILAGSSAAPFLYPLF
jgi:hypothetical protein